MGSIGIEIFWLVWYKEGIVIAACKINKEKR
jgi:hypothetical protein